MTNPDIVDHSAVFQTCKTCGARCSNDPVLPHSLGLQHDEKNWCYRSWRYGSAMALRMVKAGYDVVGTDCPSYATNFLILIQNAATAEAMSFARKLQPTDSCISDHH